MRFALVFVHRGLAGTERWQIMQWQYRRWPISHKYPIGIIAKRMRLWDAILSKVMSLISMIKVACYLRRRTINLVYLYLFVAQVCFITEAFLLWSYFYQKLFYKLYNIWSCCLFWLFIHSRKHFWEQEKTKSERPKKSRQTIQVDSN